jgi:hypothetical protein
VSDVGEEEAFVDGGVDGVLVEGGVGGALVGVPFPPHVCLATLLLVVIYFLFHLVLPFLVVVPVTITCIWTFSDKITGLTTPVANPLGAGFIVLPLPLFEDLPEALDDKSSPHCRAWRRRLGVVTPGSRGKIECIAYVCQDPFPHIG